MLHTSLQHFRKKQGHKILIIPTILICIARPSIQFYLHILQDIVEVFMDPKLSEVFAHKGK